LDISFIIRFSLFTTDCGVGSIKRITYGFIFGQGIPNDTGLKLVEGEGETRAVAAEFGAGEMKEQAFGQLWGLVGVAGKCVIGRVYSPLILH
jgi:hypothetical protein